MMKNLDIVVVGELNVDLILTGLPSLPEMGKCNLSKDMHFTLGSASAIFASNISSSAIFPPPQQGCSAYVGTGDNNFLLNLYLAII